MLRVRTNGETFVSATMCPRLPVALRLIYRIDHQAPYDWKSKEDKRHSEKEIFFKIMPNDRVNQVKKYH